ncbi:hypothetical protein J2T04_003979 [Chryseobacterium lathyri]|uniref:Uncharacterized protein n=1 Tax=Chryseobacterium lathyri TaxID=395933 RepID=A0ABT9STB7_9FLAO|nr:hypothetical protein [Chryseobacterium lathyri]
MLQREKLNLKVRKLDKSESKLGLFVNPLIKYFAFYQKNI